MTRRLLSQWKPAPPYPKERGANKARRRLGVSRRTDKESVVKETNDGLQTH